MLSLFICEDTPRHRARIEAAARDYIASKGCDIELALSTGNPTELLDYLEQHPNTPGCYILDVNLQDKINGIMLASKIRKRDAYGAIIFVTMHAELSYLVFQYKVEAMDYIIKDDVQDPAKQVEKRVQECLELAYQRYQESSLPQKRAYQVKVGTQVRLIPLDDILYFESHPTIRGKIILHTRNRRLDFYGSLDNVTEVAPEFFRCHKSYVVNVRNIKCIDTRKKEIEMVNGSVAFVAVKKATELAQRMAKYSIITQ